ncbi:MAG: hypothetical protein HYX69_21275 [Planctomycetia bacterium]|nr:hypothetical protein [Planctomycetia bacterium]
MFTMFKFVVVPLAVVAISAMGVATASAGGCRSYGGPAVAPAPQAAPAQVAPSTATAPTRSYRSYSYQPSGTFYRAPMRSFGGGGFRDAGTKLRGF